MAKLINILAASVGGGLVLGASIRLGEAIGNKVKPEGRRTPGVRRLPTELASRLDRLESKVSAPEWESVVAGVVERIDRQQTDVEAIRQQISNAASTMDSVSELTAGLRSDLQRELSGDLDRRLAAVEGRLQLRMEAAHNETVDAMVNAVETRVAPRILRMESDIAGQTAAVAELRECALQSERSIQRLLGVIERVMSPVVHADALPDKPADKSGLAIVTGRGQDEMDSGSGTVRRVSSLGAF